MKYKIPVLLILIAVLTSCNINKTIVTKELKFLNPTEHVFNIEIDSLKKATLEIFNNYNLVNSSFYDSSLFFTKKDNKKYPIVFGVELNGKSAVFGKKYFTDLNNKDDFYLHSWNDFWYSPIYYCNNEKLQSRSPFIIEFKKISKSKTLMKIKAYDLIVINGAKCRKNSFEKLSVKSTTVEEYTLILFIAEQLGINNLKPLNTEIK